MLIAQISDTHILAEAADHPAAALRADCLRRTVDDINAQQPDAVIFTGDTTQHGSPDEYARLVALLASLEAPLYVVPGNRDDNEALRTAFAPRAYLPTRGPFLHYVIEGHPYRLLAIDSTLPGERKGVLCRQRQDWLDEILAQEPERPTLLFIHHPPFDIDDHYVGGYRRPEEAIALASLISRHPQVSAMLCGHVHWPVACEWAGIQARIMPSIAVDLRKGIDEEKAENRPIYMLHRLSPDSGIESELREVTLKAERSPRRHQRFSS